jgi:hypothetical protein
MLDSTTWQYEKSNIETAPDGQLPDWNNPEPSTLLIRASRLNLPRILEGVFMTGKLQFLFCGHVLC